MKFSQIYQKREPVISFELFPPKTEQGLAQLQGRLPKLISLRPDFISVTYGALGSTRERTLEIATLIRNSYGQEVAHHLTCVGSSREELQALLEEIRARGIENIVALRGDPPRGSQSFEPPPGGYAHACQLVEHIRRMGGFGVAVAGYPEKHIEAPDFDTDLAYLKQKVDCGADVIITQLFYENACFYRFVERCRQLGIRQPIVPGLLPILDLNQVRRITQVCGASVPASLLRRLEQAGEDEARVHEIGISHAVDQAVDLLRQGVPGIHFYVLNRYFHIAEIMTRIRAQLPVLSGPV